MKIEKLTSRLPLREVLDHTEKCTRDLIDHYHGDVLNVTADLRDLSRPVRRRSHYPSLMALLNAERRLEQSSEQAMLLSDYLLEQLEEIRKESRKEQGRL